MGAVAIVVIDEAARESYRTVNITAILDLTFPNLNNQKGAEGETAAAAPTSVMGRINKIAKESQVISRALNEIKEKKKKLISMGREKTVTPKI